MKKIKSYNYRLAAATHGSGSIQLFPAVKSTNKDGWVRYRMMRKGKVFTGHCHGTISNNNK